MFYLKAVSGLILILNIANCSSLSLKIPTATIESSEVAGRSQKELGPSLEPARGIEYSNSAMTRPPTLDEAEELGTTHTLLHQARFGLGERFELGVELGFDLSDSVQRAIHLVGKFQFLGPSKVNAKEGDFSGSVFGRIGHLGAENNGDQDELFGPGGRPWDASVQAWYSMIGASFGYRLSDPFLVYLGGSLQDINSEVEVNQGAAADGSDAGGNYSHSYQGKSYSYGLGSQLRLGKVFHLHAKLMQMHFHLDGVEDQNDLYAAGGFFFYF